MSFVPGFHPDPPLSIPLTNKETRQINEGNKTLWIIFIWCFISDQLLFSFTSSFFYFFFFWMSSNLMIVSWIKLFTNHRIFHRFFRIFSTLKIFSFIENMEISWFIFYFYSFIFFFTFIFYCSEVISMSRKSLPKAKTKWKKIKNSGKKKILKTVFYRKKILMLIIFKCNFLRMRSTNWIFLFLKWQF